MTPDLFNNPTGQQARLDLAAPLPPWLPVETPPVEPSNRPLSAAQRAELARIDAAVQRHQRTRRGGKWQDWNWDDIEKGF